MENKKLISKNILVSQDMVGLRLDKALALDPLVSTRSRAEILIDSGFVIVNGNKKKASYKVLLQDEISFSIPHMASMEKIEPLDLKLDIYFEDDHLLVVNKPPGLVVHPAAGHWNDTLVNALANHSQSFEMKFGETRPGIVHRLDKETSGLLVVAKNDEVQLALVEQFKSRTVHRIYQAICLGSLNQTSGKIISYLRRSSSDRMKYSSVRDKNNKIISTLNFESDSAKQAITNFEVLKHIEQKISLVRLKLETGRTHQIRVHLSELGHPILSDSIYGSPKREKNINLNLKSSTRCALHAMELGFNHPITKKNLSFSAPWPDHHEILSLFSV